MKHEPDELIGFDLEHQEQVPRKQGLKHAGALLAAAPVYYIKSKFHENKD